MGRLVGGTRAAPGGGDEVPVGGEEVPVLWPGSTDVDEDAELWSLKSERSFLSSAWMSSLPAALAWSSAPSGSCCTGTGCGVWMDEDGTAPLNGSEGGTAVLLLLLLLGEPPPSWGPGGTDVCPEGGEMVAGAGRAAASWEGWAGGLGSLGTGAGG